MTKEELIKKEWIILLNEVWYLKIKDFISPDGWIHFNYVDTLEPEKLILLEDLRLTGKVRPKTLSGIETNNGWTKLISEKDLPKEEGTYVMGRMDSLGRFIEFENKTNRNWLAYQFSHKKITHYKLYQSLPPKF